MSSSLSHNESTAQPTVWTQTERPARDSILAQMRRWVWVEVLFVLLITVLAVMVRIYRLHDFPPGLFEDEAANGLDVLDILNGHYSVFFPRNNGREPLFFYAQALVASWAGLTPYALRLTAALIGALTIPAYYWLVRTLFAGSTLPAVQMAAWSALFLTFSYWHLSLSRLGFRAITLPLVACIAFAFLWRAILRLDRARLPWPDLLLCGFFVGLSLYTYIASRVVPLIVLLALGCGLLLCYKPPIRWQRGILALLLIGLTALLTFAPLGLYFVNHWEIVSERANEVSIFNPEVAPDGPLWALGRSVVRTALMFISLPDANLRHNPAQRPVFDGFLAGWLVVGVAISFARWRDLRYLFVLLSFGLFAVPTVLTAAALPHSLRSIGMLPAAYLLAVIGMMGAGQRLPRRFARWAGALPLIFLLFSSTTGVYDYFAAWRNLDRFRTAFLVDYARIGQSIAQYSSPESVWVLPRSPNYVLDDASPAFFTVNFFVRDRAGYGSVIFGEEQAPEQLREFTRGRRFIHVLQIEEAEFLGRVALVFADYKNLLHFLLHKNARPVREENPIDIGIPYKTFEVQPDAPYLFDQNPVATAVTFGDRVRLTQLDYGRTILDLAEPASALAERRAPAGHELWVVLRWQAETPIDYDLKTSLILKDAAGHIVSQIDQLLAGDRYPVFRVWEAGEGSSTYHIVPIPPSIPPGSYQLYVKVYEELSGRVYLPKDEAGRPLGGEAWLGPFEITPGEPTTLQSSRPFAPPARLAPDLELTGIDLPYTTLAPGDTLPITLYWHALQKPVADYRAHLQLLASDGATVAEQSHPLGGEQYATTQWRAGETLREWVDLPLTPTTPPGSYELVLRLTTGGVETGQIALDEVEVRGRVRQFEPPAPAQPVTATFGHQVRLLGVDAPVEVTVAPGDVLALPLAWQVQTAAAQPLVRFVHLLGSEGPPLTQTDGAPCDGECPATSWLADEILIDSVSLTVPPELPAGHYRLVTGWYDPTTVTRLEAYGEQGSRLAEDVVELPVRVVVR